MEIIYQAPKMLRSDVLAVLELLERADARAVATAEAQRWALAALEALAAVTIDPERRRDIEALVSFFVHRDA